MMNCNNADDFLNKFWTGEVPIQVEHLATLAGITTIHSDLVETSSVDVENKIIIVNKINSKERIRFCIAHSIGHIVLGHSSHAENVNNFSSLGFDEQSMANKFAIDLLVPPKVLKYCVGNGLVKLELLCSKFLVSEALMAAQLKSVFKIPR